MIGRLVGALLGAGPTLVGPSYAPADTKTPRRRPPRRIRRDELTRDEEEALVLLSLALAAKRR